MGESGCGGVMVHGDELAFQVWQEVACPGKCVVRRVEILAADIQWNNGSPPLRRGLRATTIEPLHLVQKRLWREERSCCYCLWLCLVPQALVVQINP